MSLLPNRFQIVNDMPSLGALVREAIQPKSADQYASFYTNTSVTLPDGSSTFISEKDCRQIKGAAQEHALGASKDLASASVAAPPNAYRDLRGKQEARKVWRHRSGLFYRLADNRTGAECSDDGKSRWGQTACPWSEDEFNDSAEFKLVSPSPDAETADSTPAVTPDDGGWIAHRPGDVQPVPNKTIVHCKLPGGELSSLPPTKATGWNWNYVVAYRVVTP